MKIYIPDCDASYRDESMNFNSESPVKGEASNVSGQKIEKFERVKRCSPGETTL